MRTPTLSVELKLAPHLVVAIGLMDRRSFVIVLWPLMVKLSVRCQP